MYGRGRGRIKGYGRGRMSRISSAPVNEEGKLLTDLVSGPPLAFPVISALSLMPYAD